MKQIVLVVKKPEDRKDANNWLRFVESFPKQGEFADSIEPISEGVFLISGENPLPAILGASVGDENGSYQVEVFLLDGVARWKVLAPSRPHQ